MKNLKTFEGYIYSYSRDLKQQSQYLDFIVLYDQAEEEFDLIPCGGGISSGPWQTIETIKNILTKKGISKNIIELVKSGSPLKNIIERIGEPLHDVGFNVVVRDLDDLKKMSAPIYLISIPSGELINISIKSIPELIEKKSIKYDKNLGKYVCKDSDYDIFKDYKFISKDKIEKKPEKGVGKFEIDFENSVKKSANKTESKELKQKTRQNYILFLSDELNKGKISRETYDKMMGVVSFEFTQKESKPKEKEIDQNTRDNYLKLLSSELKNGEISRETYFKMLKDVNMKR